MSTIQTFTGFPPEGVQFLHDLSQNNEKAWFDANKDTYVTYVQEPAVALVVALGERLQAEFPPVTYDTKLNGSGSLMRIYRDTRFSKDKSPYKTNVAMMFTPEGKKRMESAGFGLQITPQQAELIVGQFSFTKPQLQAYRDAVAGDQTGEDLVSAVKKVQSAGAYTIHGKELKRVPRGYDSDHPRAEWLKYKGLHVFAPPIHLEVMYTTEAVDAIMAHFRKMAPVYKWLMEAVNNKVQ